MTRIIDVIATVWFVIRVLTAHTPEREKRYLAVFYWYRKQTQPEMIVYALVSVGKNVLAEYTATFGTSERTEYGYFCKNEELSIVDRPM